MIQIHVPSVSEGRCGILEHRNIFISHANVPSSTKRPTWTESPSLLRSFLWNTKTDVSSRPRGNVARVKCCYARQVSALNERSCRALR